MPTIEQNKAYLEDSSRFPKQQASPLLQPRFQYSHEEYNRIIEYLDQLYQRTGQAVTQVDSVLDPQSQNPIRNQAVSEAIDALQADILHRQVAVFQSILPSGTLIQQSAAAESTPADIYFFTDAATFGFVPSASTGVSAAQPSLAASPQYYANWPNRAIYTDADLHPYASKLYFCIQQRKLYVWDGTTLQPVGGTEIQVDDTLSPTSTNPVQNKAVTAELTRLQDQLDSIENPTERHFEVDEDGCLIQIKSGADDGTSFEIDADGNFIQIIN